MLRIDQRRNDIVVLDGCFTTGELSMLSSLADSLSFEPQGAGHVHVRRERADIEETSVAEVLWQRVGLHLSPVSDWFDASCAPRLEPPLDRWEFVGCNPRSRFYRYGLGASFSEHQDEPWKPDSTTRSMLTVLVYLPRGGCEGGETVVDGEVVPVVDGRVVVFEHGLLHEGKPVERGQKLVLRNDIIAKATR